VSDGFSLCYNQTDFGIFLSVCDELENDELRLIVFNLLFNGSPLSIENCLERFRMKRHSRGDYSLELEFVSSHFCDICNQS
jgi:hypothetical protein